MAASSNQKIDYLLKKIGYTATKTGIAEDGSISGTKKSPSGEAIASPLVVPSDSVWADSSLIPTTPPGSDSATVKVYLAGTSGLRMTVDSTVSGSRSFIAYTTYNNTGSGILGNWIDTQFGSDYIIKVYKGDPNSGGVQLSAAGSGSSDGWFFDYSSGVLNFNDTNVPSGVSDTNIYIVGYRYIGKTGVVTPGGISSITQLNVSGIATIPQLQAGTVNASGIITATEFHTGASGSAIRVLGNTISGPATLTLDPAAVGDNTGTVVIAGSLQVDGTTTTVNSTTVNIVDKQVKLADGAANDAAADSAGLLVDSGDGDKTWTFQATGDNWGSSENINLATGKVLKVNNTEILSSTTLGSGVINSSLTSLGTIGSLVATTADINGGTIDNSIIGGATPAAGTFTNVTANAVLDVDGHANLDNVSISGVTTTTGAITASGGVVGDLTGNVTGNQSGGTVSATSAAVADLTSGRVVLAGTSGELEDSGNLTFNGSVLSVTGNETVSGTFDVDGATTLDGLTVAEAATFDVGVTVTGLLDANGGLAANTAKVEDLTSGRVVLAGTSGELEDSGNLTFNGSTLAITGGATVSTTLGVTGETTLASATVSDLTDNRVVIAGTSGALEDSANLTFDGSTLAVTGSQTISSTLAVTSDLSARNVTGVAATFTSNVVIGGDLSVTGDVSYDNVQNIDAVGIVTAQKDVRVNRNLYVTGITTVYGDVHFEGKLYDGEYATGSAGHLLTFDGTDTSWVNPSTVTAGNATNVTVTADSTSATNYIAFVGATSGNNGVKVDTGLTYNPSTNQLVLAGFTWPTTDGSADQVLTTDGAGALTFQTPASSAGITSISESTTTATAGQTAFTAPNVFDDGTQSKPFPVSVFVNGVRHRVGSASSCDFQLSAPQTINFNAQSAATAGDRVTIQVGFGHTISEEYFTATQDQTEFQTTSATPGAIKEKIHVYLNGVLLKRGTDYNAGSPITLGEGAEVGDEISLVSSAGEDVFTATAGQTIFTPSDNDTTPDNIEVYQNGIRLELTQDYTKGSPQVTIINPATGLDAGDELDVVITR